MITRKNHRDLTSAEKSAFVAAIIKLKNNVPSVLNPGKMFRYDDYVQIHKNAMEGPNMIMPMPHNGPLFFPWHRILLLEFEKDIQAASGDPTMAIPYWDWSLAGGDNPFTSDFMGGDGDRAQGGIVTSGPFAHSTGNFDIRVWDNGTPKNPALTREFGDDASSYLPTPFRVLSDIAKTPYYPGAGRWEVVAEGDLHNPVHRWIAGNMALATSPNDPIFFLHHCYIDLLWEKWKAQHPTTPPYAPVSGHPGHDLQSTLVYQGHNSPAPWTGSWIVSQTINPASLGYQYA